MLLSSAYHVEAMAKSSELRLKEFFQWSDNETEGSSNFQEQPQPKRKFAQPRPKCPLAQPRPLSQAANNQRSVILSLLILCSWAFTGLITRQKVRATYRNNRDVNGNSPSHVLNAHELSNTLYHKQPNSSAVPYFLC